MLSRSEKGRQSMYKSLMKSKNLMKSSPHLSPLLLSVISNNIGNSLTTNYCKFMPPLKHQIRYLSSTTNHYKVDLGKSVEIGRTPLDEEHIKKNIVEFRKIFNDNKYSMGDEKIAAVLGRKLYDLARISRSKGPSARFAILNLLYDSEVEWTQWWCKEYLLVMSKSTTKTLSNVIYSMGLLRLKPDDLCEGWMSNFLQIIKTNLNNFKSQELSNTIYSMWLLGFHPDDICEGWTLQFLQESKLKLQSFNCQELSNTAYALCKLEINPELVLPGWMTKFLIESNSKLLSFNGQDLSNIIYVLGKLKINPDFDCEGWMTNFLRQSKPKLNHFKCQELSSTIYAFGQLGIQPDNILPGWMSSFLLTSRSMLKNFKSQNFRNTMYSLGRLGIRPDYICKDWMAEFLRASKLELKNFHSQELSNTIYSMALLDIRPDSICDDGWMTEFLRVSQIKLFEFNTQGLSNTVYAFGLLDEHPDNLCPGWMLHFLKESQSKLKDFNSQQLSNTIYALGLLGIRPDSIHQGWMAEFLQVSQSKLHQFNTQELGITVYAMALLQVPIDLIYEGWISHFLKDIIPRLEISLLDNHSQMNIDIRAKFQLLLFHHFYSSQTKRVLFPDNILLSLKSDVKTTAISADSRSRSEIGLWHHLEKLFPGEFAFSVYLHDIGIVVDYFNEKSNLVIQYDGKSHFRFSSERNSRHMSSASSSSIVYNTSTILQTKFLEGLGYKVIRINYRDWNMLKNQKCKEEELNKLIKFSN